MRQAGNCRAATPGVSALSQGWSGHSRVARGGILKTRRASHAPSAGLPTWLPPHPNIDAQALGPMHLLAVAQQIREHSAGGQRVSICLDPALLNPGLGWLEVTVLVWQAGRWSVLPVALVDDEADATRLCLRPLMPWPCCIPCGQGWNRLRSPDGTPHLATSLAQPDDGDAALLLRYRPAPDHGLQWRQWLSAWVDCSVTGAAERAVTHAWWRLQATVQCMADWHLVLQATPPQQAWALARHACMTGQADVFAGDTLAAQARWQAQTGHQAEASDWNRWLGQLAPHADAMDRALLQCLQQGSPALLQRPGTGPAQVWQLLESGRFSLLSAVPGALPAVAWDARAQAAVNAAAQGAAAMGEACWAARQAGRPPLPGPLPADLPAEPIATLARDWQRLGVDLPLPGPAQAARHLATDEVLAQFWWDEQGAGHALLLGPGCRMQAGLPMGDGDAGARSQPAQASLGGQLER